MQNELVHQIIQDKASWLNKGELIPYVYVRPENQIANPGTGHRLDWFQQEPVYKNPLKIAELGFAEQLYFLEGKAFGPSNMAMPRWVFYDCAVMPGFVAGFCMKADRIPSEIRKVLRSPIESDYVPLSLFIIIPTMHRGEWVAHNLCSVNSLLPTKSRYYALGFLSKAFGLWYANVEQCSGMTQWGSPALKLHSHYGHLEILGAYAPVHSHARTLTYRVSVQTRCWEQFFTRDQDFSFLENYQKTDISVDPKNEQSQISLQKRIEAGEGPYFLNAIEISEATLDQPLNLYSAKSRSANE